MGSYLFGQFVLLLCICLPLLLIIRSSMKDFTGLLIAAVSLSYIIFCQCALLDSISCYWPVLRCIITGILAVLCLLYSNCFIEWLIPDEYDYYSRWLTVFRDAQSFRFSHYFISLISEVGLLVTGFDIVERDFAVVRPLRNEIPRSLVDVVRNWNIPMHNWLKFYVFRKTQSMGNFAGIFATYAASSLLHGLNFQILAVLLSLGFYTYTEYGKKFVIHKFRDTFSQVSGRVRAEGVESVNRLELFMSGLGYARDSVHSPNRHE